MHGQPIDERDAASSGLKHSGPFSSDSFNEGPVLLSAAGPSQAQSQGRRRGRGNEDAGSSGATSNTSVKSGLNTWVVGIGLGLLGVVAWATLGMGPTDDGGTDEAVVSPTTLLPPSDVEEAAPDLAFDLEETDTDLVASGPSRPEYVARTSDGLTPMEAVGEPLGFSVVADFGSTPVFINPNDGTYGDVPAELEGLSLLTETYAVHKDFGQDGEVVSATELWATDSEPVFVFKSLTHADLYLGPEGGQIWIDSGKENQGRDLIDLRSGEVLATESPFDYRRPLSVSPTEVFSPRGGGIYERVGSTVTKLSDEFGVAVSEDLFLVDRCDVQARCTSVWLDRQTLELLDYPELPEIIHLAAIDPTSRWLFSANYFLGESVIREIATGREVFEMGIGFDEVTFSPDGQWLAIEDAGPHVRFVHVATGTEFTTETQRGQSWGTSSAMFFPLDYTSRGSDS